MKRQRVATGRSFEQVKLDVGRAAETPDLLESLSGIATAGQFLWTASDETRTLECLRPNGHGFELHRQFSLDRLFPELPGRPKPGEKKGDEADLETLDVAGGRLWLCGSHCRVRRQTKRDDLLDPDLRTRKSRQLFGAAWLADDGGTLTGEANALPVRGKGSLRHLFENNDYVAPFVKLPSKENGLDIEGMVVIGKRVLFGLRGPLIDSMAVVLEVPIDGDFTLDGDRAVTHLLDLGGVGIRDLARWDGKDIIILTGPVAGADGPFRLHLWRPKKTPFLQTPEVIFDEWGVTREHPEGICRFDRAGKSGLLILYDSPDTANRVRGSTYTADWLALSSSKTKLAS